MPLIRRACLDKVGGYSTLLRERGGEGCEDWDLYLRIGEYFSFRVVPEYLAAHRRHPGNMSSNRPAMARSHRMVIEAIEQRGTPVPARVLRWSKARRCLFELRTAYRERRYRPIVSLVSEAMSLDPLGLIAFLYSKAAARVKELSRSEPSETVRPANPYDSIYLSRFNRVCESHRSALQNLPAYQTDD